MNLYAVYIGKISMNEYVLQGGVSTACVAPPFPSVLLLASIMKVGPSHKEVVNFRKKINPHVVYLLLKSICGV